MRRTILASFTLLCLTLACRAQSPLPQVPAGQSTSRPAASTEAVPAQAAATLPPEVEAALGVAPLLQQLKQLHPPGSIPPGDADAIAVLTLHQQILERLLPASFEVDSVLGRIDTEASYSGEDRYVLQTHAQRQATLYNLVTFAASGALGAAGGAMQLTRGLNHAGTALSAAGGSTALVLSGAQLLGAGGGGKRAIRSPYNMLAEILGATPNPESRYPPLVQAYLEAPRADGQPSIAAGLTAAWHRLNRIQTGKKGDGAALNSLTADRSANLKLSADDLADREAMLQDLRANVTLLHADLQTILLAIMAPAPAPALPDPAHAPEAPRRQIPATKPVLPPTP